MGVDSYSTLGRTIDRGAEGAEVERRRRENRGAVGAEGGGMWVWGGGSAPSPENFSIADLKMVSVDAFCVIFKSLVRSVNT